MGGACKKASRRGAGQENVMIGFLRVSLGWLNKVEPWKDLFITDDFGNLVEVRFDGAAIFAPEPDYSL